MLSICLIDSLGLHTELISDGVMDLFESGALTGTQKVNRPGKLIATFALGTRRLYDFLHDNSAVEFLPVDNVDGRYRSAGAALNHGASMARNDVVVFVHQDVFLHSLAAVIRAASTGASVCKDCWRYPRLLSFRTLRASCRSLLPPMR